MFPEPKLTAAGYFFASANGNEMDASQRAEILVSGLNGADPAVVAGDICDGLENASDLSNDYRAAAFWALGKRFDPGLIPFFRRHLMAEMGRDMGVAYQIMIALDNLAEPVWPAHWSSRSILDHRENHQFASVYLDHRA